MHCSCCDRLLNDYESTRKSKTTGEYLDMCNKCFKQVELDIDAEDRKDLYAYDVPDDEVEFESDCCVNYELDDE